MLIPPGLAPQACAGIQAMRTFQSIVETLEIMDDEDLMASLRKAVEEVAEGKTIPWAGQEGAQS